MAGLPRGAALSGRPQRPTGRRSLGQASPTCLGRMVNGPVCRVALLHEGGRRPQCCRLGVSTSRVRRWTCCGQGVGAGAGTQMSSHPAHGWARVQREFPRGHVVAQAARLSSGGQDPFYLIKSQGTREGTGPPSTPPPHTHTHSSCSAGKAGVSHHAAGKEHVG